jgi:hypothetical protein
MDPEAVAQISPHLLAGESMLWCGRPHETGAIVLRVAIIVVLGAIVHAMRLFAPESTLGAAVMQSSILLAAIVLLLLTEGALYHLFLGSTFYAVTNQRVIILSGLREREPAGFLLDRLNTPMLKVKRQFNTVAIYSTALEAPPGNIFDPTRGYLPFTNPSVPPAWQGRGECYKLVGIHDAGRVYTLILDAAHKLGDADFR